MSAERDRPSVLAVVVATDGAPTLPRALEGLAAQEYPDLTVVGVDNGSRDETRRLLVDALGADAVLVADRDLGFGGAVDMALASSAAVGRALVLLVHDDMQLRPDAVAQLVGAFERDPQLAVAGCKLVEWDDPRQLQAVGMRIDVTGRADSGVDGDEIDQGQHDHVAEVLYVSTAGMMVDRARFDALGGFDVRYHLFRDDLDLCWRAHLAGHRVEVVTGAVAEHEASASTYGRLGQTAFLGPRYFAERNTLASLLKNHGAARLVLVLPLFLVVGGAKVVGFLATRRLGDAWQTVRAWAWNLLHLRETWRLRRAAQAGRTRSDAELRPLFGRVGTRLRAYVEALGDAVAGGTEEHEPVDPDHVGEEVPTVLERVRRTVRTSPVAVAAGGLVLLGLAVGIPLLAGGGMRGGELGAWPAGWTSLFDAYVEPWRSHDLPGVQAPSPLVPVLGVASLLAAGSGWLAPRLLLLAAVPVAWVSALAAGRLVTTRRVPRVAGATLYALSPPLLAALRTGQVRAVVAAGLLPIALLASTRVVDPRVAPDRAWRATALLAVVSAVLVAAVPTAVVLVLVTALSCLVGVVVARPRGALATIVRIVAVLVGAAGLLALSPPAWPGPVLLPGASVGSTALWRVLLLAPDLPGFVLPLAGLGLVAGALLGLVVVDRGRRDVVAVLWVLLLASLGTAWWLVRLGGAAPVWPGTALLPGALAAALLLGVAFSAASRVLGAHTFGWRQLATAATTVVVLVGVVGAVVVAVRGPWDGYDRGDTALPGYLASETGSVGPFRVLVLADGTDGVHWQLTDADGPSVGQLGQQLDATAQERVGAVVADVLGDGDPDAAGRLGPLGIRYVVVPGRDDGGDLRAVLARQFDLSQQPSVSATVLRVDTWLPRWTVLDPTDADALVTTGRLPAEADPVPLADRAPGAGGVLVEVDAVPGPWRLEADGEPVEPTVDGPTRTWDLPAGSRAVVLPDGGDRRLRVTGQVLLLLLLLSLALRAPRFARPGRRTP